MKRFYCTVCRKVKRVQKWPLVIETPSAENVYERTGECNRHSGNVVVRHTPNRYVKPAPKPTITKATKFKKVG